MNKQEIMNLLYGAHSQYAMDALDLKKKILDIIEGSENKSN